MNRRTSSGEPLGLEYRVTPYQALRAITIDAAYQYGEDDRKGTLQAGKLADMVIPSTPTRWRSTRGQSGTSACSRRSKRA